MNEVAASATQLERDVAPIKGDHLLQKYRSHGRVDEVREQHRFGSVSREAHSAGEPSYPTRFPLVASDLKITFGTGTIT